MKYKLTTSDRMIEIDISFDPISCQLTAIYYNDILYKVLNHNRVYDYANDTMLIKIVDDNMVGECFTMEAVFPLIKKGSNI